MCLPGVEGKVSISEMAMPVVWGPSSISFSGTVASMGPWG